jgi:hypothetical protein
MDKKPKFVEYCWEYVPRDEEKINNWIIPSSKGIYALFKKRGKYFNVVYIGMARGGLKGKGKSGFRSRLRNHLKSKEGWDHFSAYRFFDKIKHPRVVNIVEEIEGLLRAIYRKDKKANILNKQKRFKKLYRVLVAKGNKLTRYGKKLINNGKIKSLD